MTDDLRRVLHVIPEVGVSQGGLRTALLNICRAQLEVGIRAEVACCAGASSPAADWDDAAIELHCFACNFRPTGASREMKRWLQKNAHRYDAVVAHSLWRAPLLYAARARGDKPLIVMAHGMLDPEAMRYHRVRKRLWLRAGLSDVLARATVVYTCEAERTRAQQGPGGLALRSRVIPLPVKVAESPPASTGGPIVALGRIHQRKGWLEWVEALKLLFAERVDFRAEQAGPVEDHRYARRVYAAAGPLTDAGVLRFHGPLTYRDAQAMLARAGVVTAPCAVHENFSMVIAEAMAHARPVLAGRKGLLVEELEKAGAVRGAELTPHGFASALAALLADAAARATLARAGHAWAREFLAPARVGGSWLELLHGSSTI